IRATTYPETCSICFSSEQRQPGRGARRTRLQGGGRGGWGIKPVILCAPSVGCRRTDLGAVILAFSSLIVIGGRVRAAEVSNRDLELHCIQSWIGNSESGI